MFSLPSGPELVFVVGLALIIFGPKRLPEIGRTIGQGLRELRKASREITEAFDVSEITSSLPKVDDILADDDFASDTSSDWQTDTVSDFEPDRVSDQELDDDVDCKKENEQDAADSLDTEWTGAVDCPCDSDSALRSEETAGDRQVDG